MPTSPLRSSIATKVMTILVISILPTCMKTYNDDMDLYKRLNGKELLHYMYPWCVYRTMTASASWTCLGTAWAGRAVRAWKLHCPRTSTWYSLTWSVTGWARRAWVTCSRDWRKTRVWRRSLWVDVVSTAAPEHNAKASQSKAFAFSKI